MAPSSPSSRNWVHDVFPSFSGKDIRKNFLSHLRKELDLKLITSFNDNEIERSRSLDPVLVQAIKDSKIAVVVFSKKYASSSWCLNELLEIVKCKKEFDQIVIPVFYGLDPTHVRKQTGVFGKNFETTCKNRTEDKKQLWRQALTDVADIVGYHSKNWDDEAKMIEEITSDILDKLKFTQPKDFDDFVGMEHHIEEMNSRLRLESEEVEMVGIWGPSGIGKTTIARAVFNRVSCHFQASIFIDRAFISKSMKIYGRANTDDYNMRLHLQRNFLSEILGKKHIRIDHLGAVGEMLKHKKVLIVIDDLDDQVVLDTLAGQAHWFGNGSRIIVITKDRHLLRAHGIGCVYEIGLPSDKQALEMLCRYAFRQRCPLPGFTKFAVEVANLVGYLPLGLKALGSYLRGRDKEDWILHGLRKGLNRKIEEALRVDYEGLGSRNDKAIFRHIACLFNEVEINDIKLLLEDSDLDVCTGLDNLLDNSLIHERWNVVRMHCLVQEMGKERVRTQSKNPRKREFLMDSNEIRDVLSGNADAEKVSGISLNLGELEAEFRLDKNAFKKTKNLRFMRIYEDSLALHKQRRLHLPEGLDYLPPQLRLLCWDNYPLKCLPSNFTPDHLVVLRMRNSKLERLWDRPHSLTLLEELDIRESRYLRELPDLSTATSLMTLKLSECSELVELPDLSMLRCLKKLTLIKCCELVELPDLSMLPSLMTLNLSECARLEVIPSSIGKWKKLEDLIMTDCTNVETLPTDTNMKSLYRLDLGGCSRFRSFPDISTNISYLFLNQTAIEEVPWWIENFSKLKSLEMWECKKLKFISPNISKLKLLEKADFSNCEALTEASWLNFRSAEDVHTKLPVLTFINCFNLNQEALIQKSVFKYMILPGGEVPSYFTNQAIGSTLDVRLFESSLSQQSLRFKVCLVVDAEKPKHTRNGPINSGWVCCHFTCKDGNRIGSADCRIDIEFPRQIDNHLIVFDCCFPVSKDYDPLLEVNYTQVDTEFHFTSDSLCKIRGCGIRLSCNQNVLAHVWEGDESEADSDLSNETEHREETERSRKRIKIT